jgi:hypothetical protein
MTRPWKRNSGLLASYDPLADRSPEESPGALSLLADDSVARGAEPILPRAHAHVHPGSQPMSQSTKSGLSTSRCEIWPDGEDSGPGVAVVAPWREKAQASSLSGREFRAAVTSECSPLFQSLALGVGQANPGVS